MARPIFPENVKANLISQMHSDPGLPRSHPTSSSWQEPPHPLSEVQSENVPMVIDFVVIGSGVTGCSVAKHLLENCLSGDKKVTVFEARSLTSGATGRNGGHLLSHIPKIFKDLSGTYGRNAAIKIARFCSRTLENMAELAISEGPEIRKASEFRNVQAILGFQEEKAFSEGISSVQLYEDSLAETKGMHKIINKENAEKYYCLRDTVGALSTPAGVFWPYRLITGVFDRLLTRHSHRFSIETGTPVTSINYSPDTDGNYPYVLVTPRGTVRTSQVFHCANGFSGHLLPRLRGKIFPYRATMSYQDPGPQFPNLGSKLSWLFYKGARYDPSSGTLESGLSYMQQNAATGNLFCGGDKRYLNDMINSNDAQISDVAKSNISTFVPRMFSEERSGLAVGVTESEHQKTWSGVIGMTPDSFPLVGKLPESITGRAVNGGEWIAAGFNGNGMPQCWSCGEAIARMALGEPMPEWLPELYSISEERLNDERMGIEAALSPFYGR